MFLQVHYIDRASKMDIILRSLSNDPTTETSTKNNCDNNHGKDCESPGASIASCIEDCCGIGSSVDYIPHGATFLLTNAAWIHCLVRSPRGGKRELGAHVGSLITCSLSDVSSLTRASEVPRRLSTRIIILSSCKCGRAVILSFCRTNKKYQDEDQGRE